MSVILTNTPAPFQPVLSDGIFFTLSANTSNTYKFRYVYDLYVEDEFVFRGKCTPNPYGLGIADLQQVLETYTENNPISYWNTTPIYTHETFPFSRPYTNEVINYYIKVGYEYSSTDVGNITGFTGVNNEVGNPAYTSDVYKTFRSTMGVNGRATQQDFNIGPFVLSGSPVSTNPTTSGLFLTNSPRVRDIAENEYYTLAFTNYYLTSSTGSTYLSEPYYVYYKFYDNQGSLITGYTYENITGNGGGPRTSCTQVYQSLFLLNPSSGTTDYNTLYIGAGPANIPNVPSGATYYTVQLYGLFEGTTTPIQPSPTPTPTASPGSVTPTPTPTPSTTPVCSGCTTYDIYYTGESAFTVVTIVNCQNGASQNFQANFGQIYQVCSCQYPLTSEDVEITTVGSCVPAPTPSTTTTRTPTPTSTPPPSATCAYKSWNITECGGACSGGLCTCTTPSERTVYTSCSVTDILDSATAIYENTALTNPFTGDFVYGGSDIYTSSGSDVTFVCTIGGPC